MNNFYKCEIFLIKLPNLSSIAINFSKGFLRFYKEAKFNWFYSMYTTLNCLSMQTWRYSFHLEKQSHFKIAGWLDGIVQSLNKYILACPWGFLQLVLLFALSRFDQKFFPFRLLFNQAPRKTSVTKLMVPTVMSLKENMHLVSNSIW